MDVCCHESSTKPTSDHADISSDISVAGYERKPTGLFNLFPELRNKIYEYALMSDNPLLCVMSPITYPNRKPKIIPPESEVHGISLQAAVIRPSFNQLQFVNRQLRHETAGLEIKFNPIRFPRTVLDGGTSQIPMQGLLAFRAACSTTKFLWLTDVRLRSLGRLTETMIEPWGSSYGILPVVDFCKTHPHIQVQYVPVDFAVWSDDYRRHIDFFLHFGAALTLAVRRDNGALTECLLDSGPFGRSSSPTWVETIVQDALINGQVLNTPSVHVRLDQVFSGISNLRIFPSMERVDNEAFANYRYGYSSGGPLRRVGDFPEQQQEKWLKWAQTWVKDGIKPDL